MTFFTFSKASLLVTLIQQAARIYLHPANHVPVTLMPEKR